MLQTANTHEQPVLTRLLRAPGLTVARLTLVSYLRSGWMWSEFALVVVLFAMLYFPFKESTTYFNGTTIFCLGALAILGPAIMVRQAVSARTYLLLARLTSRAAYSRGLMLAAVALRLPLYLFFLLLVLGFGRLTDASLLTLLWGLVGILPATMLIAQLTIGLCAPIATRGQRIIFLLWIVIVLFSFKPVLDIPDWLDNILSVTRLPLWPLQTCYTLGLTGSFDLFSLLALLLLAIYAVLISLIAGYWLEKRELLFH